MHKSAELLVPLAVLASEYSPNNLHHQLMLLWPLRGRTSLRVCGYNICKNVARVLFADDFADSQRLQKRLANAKGSHPFGFVEQCVIFHFAVPL
jgi:hypothetical protein